jgi:UDP-N-acetylmuramoyl-tripeptide--D-alanyl-D-alanine ligase
MELALGQIEQETGASLLSGGTSSAAMEELRAKTVSGWSIDSRSIVPGDLFFAIKGGRFDGHKYVPAAFRGGAVAALVSEPGVAATGPLFQVKDTVLALQQLGKRVRKEWNKPVVAITGSAGKTSTKDIIAELLSVRYSVGKTIGNLNNHIGLPLTLLRLPGSAEVAVVELGMNHAGEIRELAAIASPQIGVVTNVGYAHVETFQGIEGIAAAKRELIEALPPDGVAVLNADDERVFEFRKAHSGRTLTYGTSAHAEVRAEEIITVADCSQFKVDGVKFESRLAGRHSVANILAGLAVARAFDIPFDQLTAVVARLTPGRMRGERRQVHGATILNDAYNSNPEAARSMIDALMKEPAARRVAVLGDMLELGKWAEPLHREIGRYAVERGVDVLVGIGAASRWMVQEWTKAGSGTRAAFFFEEPESAGAFLREFVQAGDALLFKGSRGVRVEAALAKMEE